MASTYLSRTFGSAGNQKTWTWSFWTKIPNYDASNNKAIFSGYNDANNLLKIQFANTDQFQSYGLSGGTLVCRLLTNQLFRDYNGWYHIVYSLDTTQATSTDRQKLWVNGEEITSFSTRTDPSQNADLQINNTIGHQIGAANNADHYSNCMAHCHFIDGTRYDASYFGETDATTLIWKPKTAPVVTYGTNGFFLKFENSASFGTDSSGNANNFTVNGTMTQTIDTPSNVFATWNPLDNYYPAMTLSNGNTRALTITNKYTHIPTTLGMTSGKYYAEIKCTAQSGSQDAMVLGITSTQSGGTTQELGNNAHDWGYYATNGNYRNNDTNNSYGSSFTTGDIIGIALDLDNNKLYFSKNGTFQNSGDPTSGATGTGAISITDSDSTPRGAYFFAVNNWSSTTNATFEANFGNGYFGTTAVSSAENPDDGIGIFEYEVPTGYKALCTKSINAQEYS